MDCPQTNFSRNYMTLLEYISTTGKQQLFMQKIYLPLLLRVGSGVNLFLYVRFQIFIKFIHHYLCALRFFLPCTHNSQVAKGTANEHKSHGLNGFTIFWGGLVRVDVLKVLFLQLYDLCQSCCGFLSFVDPICSILGFQVLPETCLTFYGPKSLRIHVVPTDTADEFYQVNSINPSMLIITFGGCFDCINCNCKFNHRFLSLDVRKFFLKRLWQAVCVVPLE